MAEPNALGSQLRRLRKARGLSQQEMAQALGLSSHSSVAYYEQGRRIPHATVIDAYERVLGQAPGALHQVRLSVLSERAEGAEGTQGESVTAASPPPAAVPGPEPSLEPDPGPTPSPDPVSMRRRGRLLPVALLIALVFGTATASAGVAASGPSALDSTWTQSTQNVTDRAETSAESASPAAPEDMDGDDPRARDCSFDAVVVQAVPLYLPGGGEFGTLRLRHSAHCGASWGSALYSNPRLYTIRITVVRPSDGATIQDDWSNNTPPGSYSDVLSTEAGCVWVEAVVITPQGTSAPAKTGCFT